MSKIIIVQGGQWGSEAKGAIASYICNHEQVDIAVRTGATNAGHTAYFDGKPVVMQQLPVGWTNPDTDLVLGAGALIDPYILAREVAEVETLTGRDIRGRLLVDHRAGVHLPEHKERSKQSGRHHAIGATGKGCSEALIDKIRLRGKGYQTFGMTEFANNYKVVDTVKALNDSFDGGAKILLEGTQGQLLDLHLGPYPYTTHKQTGPAVWMAEAGLSPALPTDIVMVVRTYPIRVAGNSGPMPLEMTWPALARIINRKLEAVNSGPIVTEESLAEFEYALSNVLRDVKFESEEAKLSEANKLALEQLSPEVVSDLRRLFEMTTVTRKLRRVARIHWKTLHDSAKQIRPHRVALTFMNYEFPEYWYRKPENGIPDGMKDYLKLVSDSCRAPITHVTFGPADEHVTAVGR